MLVLSCKLIFLLFLIKFQKIKPFWNDAFIDLRDDISQS